MASTAKGLGVFYCVIIRSINMQTSCMLSFLIISCFGGLIKNVDWVAEFF